MSDTDNVMHTPKSLCSAPKSRRLTDPQNPDEIKVKVFDSSSGSNTMSMGSSNDSELTLKCAELSQSIKIKEEKLRKLKLIQTYRTKNDLDDLDKLIEKWLQICQTAVMDLYDKIIAEPKPTLTQLIDHLKIDHKLINFNAEEEDFCNN